MSPLQDDPLETHNMIDKISAQERITYLRCRLVQWMLQVQSEMIEGFQRTIVAKGGFS